jgi:hypothetical protein
MRNQNQAARPEHQVPNRALHLNRQYLLATILTRYRKREPS